MVKQKRNVTGTAEFTGFSAFASHTSSAAAALQLAHQQAKEKHTPAAAAATTTTTTTAASSSSGNKLRPNPIYAGNDARLHQIFKRITKKDSTTKSRALAELADCAFPCDASDLPLKHVSTSTSKSTSKSKATSTPLQKNEQVAVLTHFFYLFANKLIHDNNSSVRSEALKVFENAMVHVPKACNALLRQDAFSVPLDLSLSTTVGGGNVGAIGNVIGWTYSFQSSQVMEEVRASKRVWSGILSTLEKFQDANTDGDENGNAGDDGDGNAGDDVERFVKRSIVSHVESLLQASSRATNLAEALSVAAQKSQSIQNNNDSGKGGGKGKGKGKGQPDNSTDVTGPSESEKEEIEERYERVVTLTLRATASLLCEYPEGDGVKFCYDDIVTQPNILWKHLNSTKGNFRRETFALVSCIAQNAASLIHDKRRGSVEGEGSGDRKKSNLPLLLLNILSSERDPANFAALFEMILLFIASFRNFESGVKLAWESKVSDEGCCVGMDPNAFVKSMSKALKRACYGSPSTQWAPTMLPIIVTLQSPEHQLQVLSSLVSCMCDI